MPISDSSLRPKLYREHKEKAGITKKKKKRGGDSSDEEEEEGEGNGEGDASGDNENENDNSATLNPALNYSLEIKR